MGSDTTRRMAAEFIGTFTLVFAGIGSAVLDAAFPQFGIGFMGVGFAVGLSVLAMAYAVGHVSGGHFNPAVTLGLWAAGRCANYHVAPYLAAQLAGAIVGAGVLYVVASGQPGWVMGGFACNGYGDLSPGKFNLASCFLVELLLTFLFLVVIVGTTSKGAATGFAGIPIGLALVLFHLMAIPVSNAGFNPARSTATALFAGGAYVGQLWMFWAAPILGAMGAGFLARWIYAQESQEETIVVEKRMVTP